MLLATSHYAVLLFSGSDSDNILSLWNRSEESSAGCMLSIKALFTAWALVAQVLQLSTQTRAQGNLLKLYALQVGTELGMHAPTFCC